MLREVLTARREGSEERQDMSEPEAVRHLDKLIVGGEAARWKGDRLWPSAVARHTTH